MLRGISNLGGFIEAATAARGYWYSYTYNQKIAENDKRIDIDPRGQKNTS